MNTVIKPTCVDCSSLMYLLEGILAWENSPHISAICHTGSCPGVDIERTASSYMKNITVTFAAQTVRIPQPGPAESFKCVLVIPLRYIVGARIARTESRSR